MKLFRIPALLVIAILTLSVLAASGCAVGQYNASRPAGPMSHHSGTYIAQSGPGIIVSTYDNDEIFFSEESWELTWDGIRGRATISASDGSTWSADTTLSYRDAAAARPADRGSGMKNYLLTVLGIVLVIGLAAIILYAAFLATDR